MSAKKYMKREKTTLDTESGEIKTSSSECEYHYPSEENYIKSYNKYSEYLIGMPRTHKELIELLLREYASPASKGMEVIISKGVKDRLCKRIGVKSVHTIDTIISDLKKGYLLFKVAKGIYVINPLFWGVGKWPDIVDLREKVIENYDMCNFGETSYNEVVRINTDKGDYNVKR